MRLFKVTFIMLVAALLTFGLYGTSNAFHSGGVAECDGCHTMHNSEDGEAMSTTGGLTQYNAGPYLLQGSTQSEACLNCHQHEGDTGPSSYHISTATADMAGNAPLQMTPGGDFGWIRNDINFLVRGGANVNEGHLRGHNIVATAYGYDADTTYTEAPGGTGFPVGALACSSCHDPHSKYRRIDTNGTLATTGLPIYSSGSYDNSPNPTAWGAVGVYRLLGGIGYEPKSNPGYGFTANPPDAVAPSTYNRSEAATQTRVAYGKGMSEWCGNCHGEMVENAYVSGEINHTHPAGNSAVLGALATNYQNYVKSGDMGGAGSASYSSLTPFEEASSDYITLKSHAKNDNSVLAGPSGTSTVNCLTCHRAHASAFKYMTRFAHENEFMTIADSAGVAIYDPSATEGKINRGMTAAEQQAAYYGRAATAFAPYQRLLCNKCHAKD